MPAQAKIHVITYVAQINVTVVIKLMAKMSASDCSTILENIKTKSAKVSFF